jgi:DNA-binding NarL/FixJ family response regulator
MSYAPARHAPRETWFRTAEGHTPVEPILSFQPREIQLIGELMRTGAGNKEIGAVMGLTEGSTKVYFQHIRAKLLPFTGDLNRTQLAQWAERSGLFGNFRPGPSSAETLSYLAPDV